ncbi:CIC11C00000004377 [Sungouiella intermedia]|uniref:2-dehydropantolactone reductase n=1 Tax=Sungouiella intermedia TaxID=45354 RepID=A0A1L0CYI9_9ASCO|nr:CIC11C00000004377 [[Candida] intermedia]SGZ52981.1 CIC11C00000004756 [[Candida] intermedia]
MSLEVNTDIITLNDGTKIPVVGLGTWRATEKGAAANSVKVALESGYRHIDTAAIYGNEEEVGEGIKAAGLPRSEIYVTTKLWNTAHDDVEGALNTSLKKLGLDYVDLYLIHWPISVGGDAKATPEEFDYLETYKKVQKLVGTGKVKSVGISNFTKDKIQKLLADKDVTVKPVVNQIEAHPLLPQEDLKSYLTQEGIVIEAYSPLGSNDSPLFKNETIVSIAKKNNVEPAQVLISWAVQRGTVVLPKSVTESRIISNLKTFQLSDEDFFALNKLSEKDGVVRTCDPVWDVFN